MSVQRVEQLNLYSADGAFNSSRRLQSNIRNRDTRDVRVCPCTCRIPRLRIHTRLNGVGARACEFPGTGEARSDVPWLLAAPDSSARTWSPRSAARRAGRRLRPPGVSRQVAQHRPARTGGRGPARSALADWLAGGPAARRRDPHGRDLGDHRDGRRPGLRRQRHASARCSGTGVRATRSPFIYASSAATYGDGSAGLRRRRQPRGPGAPAPAECLWLEQALLRPPRRAPIGGRRAGAAAMGRPQVLQRLRPERVPQGPDAERGRPEVSAGGERPAGHALHVASPRLPGRRAAARLRLRR